MTERRIQHEVSDDEAGSRLDAVCAKVDPQSSRSRLARLIRTGHVLLDGSPARPSERVRAGQSIELTVPELEEATARAEPIPLQIVHEDEHVLVIDKPAGLVVHPGAGVRDGTLVSALLHFDASLAGVGGQARAGLVHRLDRGTSGLMVIARNDLAHRRLSEQFQQRSVDKLYHAIVWGRPRESSGEIAAAIGRDPKTRVKMSTRSRFGRPAITRYEVAEQVPGFARVNAHLVTGRTHQIRVHLQSIGHPLVGDSAYGGDRAKSITDPQRRKVVRAFTRPALHARRLRFTHPIDERELTFVAAWPNDLVTLWTGLGGRVP